MKSVLITEIEIGDVINVNTGYRPLDDENCEVLKIRHSEGMGMFKDKCIEFFIKSKHGNHWYENPIYGSCRHENPKGIFKNRKFEYKILRVKTKLDK